MCQQATRTLPGVVELFVSRAGNPGTVDSAYSTNPYLHTGRREEAAALTLGSNSTTTKGYASANNNVKKVDRELRKKSRQYSVLHQWRMTLNERPLYVGDVSLYIHGSLLP